MNLFTKADFERLSNTKEPYCVTIYMPTHTSGMDVNESLDRIAFKNKVQKVREEMEAYGHKNINQFLQKANELVDNNMFWKEQSEGLAVFMNSSMFEVFRVPIPLEELYLVAPVFELSPMLPMLVENDTFYTLSLSLKKIRLFKNSTFNYEEVDISKLTPGSIESLFEVFNFNKEGQVKQSSFGGLSTSTPGKSSDAIHGSNPKDKETKYVAEYLQGVDKGLKEIFKDEHAPLVLAGVESICSIYKEVSSYQYIESEVITGNTDRLNDRQLFEEATKVLGKKLNKERKKDLERYSAWAGTGKTSYDLETIIAAAFEGKIDCLYISKGYHLWGIFDFKKNKAMISKEKQKGDICIINLITEKTIENNGKAYLVTKEEMPEKAVNTDIAALFRY